MESLQTKIRYLLNRYTDGYYGLIIPFTLALLVLNFRASTPGLTFDGAVYLQIARNILLTKELGWQAGMFLPFHSILIAAVSFLFNIQDLLAATGIVVHGMFILLVMAVYALSLEVFDRRTAIIAAIVTAFFPHLIFIANSPEPEISYSFFLLLSLLLYVSAIKRNSYLLAGLTGFAFAMAYLTRSEAFIIMGSVFLGTTAIQGRGFLRTAVFRFSALATLIFFIASMPYLMQLKEEYGKFVLHPKATNVMLIVNWHVPNETEEQVSYAELWRLNKEGEFFWQEPKGFKDILQLFIHYPRESLAYYFKSFARQIPGRIPNNSGMERFPQVFPIYLVIAAFFSFKWGTWGEFAQEKKCLLLAPFLILFTLPLLGGWWKYLVPYLPILIILAVRGLVNISDALSRRFSSSGLLNSGHVFLLVATLLLILRFVVALQPPNNVKTAQNDAARLNYSEEVKKVGEWASKRFEPGKNYMIQWSRLIYYLNGLWTQEPLTETAEIIEYARKKGVDYYVKEIFEQNISLQDIKATPEGVQFVDLYISQDGKYKVAFYKIIK